MFSKKIKKIKQDRRGSALLLTMVILVSGVLIFSSITAISLMQRSASSKARHSAEALQLADSCAEWTLMKYYDAVSGAEIGDIATIVDPTTGNSFPDDLESNLNVDGNLNVGVEEYPVGDCEIYFLDSNYEIIGSETTEISSIDQIRSVGKAGFGDDKVTRAIQVGIEKACPTTVDDIDGTTYDTVEIGNQCWMAENLNIGFRISGSSNQTDDGTIEKYCYDNEPNCDTYGGLYQWDEAMQYTTGAQGICPTGWHIPTNSEIDDLLNHLGGDSSVAGGEMKQTGTFLWDNPNEGATNSSGFTGLPAGMRNPLGDFLGIQGNAFFWTSSEESLGLAYYWNLQSSSARISSDVQNKSHGYSVRCIKD